MEGKEVPNVVFKAREGGDWKDISTNDLFANKTVALFSLPGAFTPTCSSTHVPRFNELAPLLRENGIDEIVCMSVNDGFVMESWKADQKADNITFVPDGNGEFTEKMGLLVDKSDIGFGKRSWRYSAIIKNKIVTKMFIEPQKPGDPFEVSDADTMLSYLNPNASRPADITVFTKPGCSVCAKAKALLQSRNLALEEIVVGRDTNLRGMRSVSGRLTTPQVFINGKHIGGHDDLVHALQ